MTRAAGIDLSLTGTGVACAHGSLLIESSGTRADTLTDRGVRLNRIVAQIVTRLQSCPDCPNLDLVLIEGPSYGSKGGSQHDRSGLWWLVVDTLAGLGLLPIVEVPPKTLKKYATGNGNADKDAVLVAAVRLLPIEVSNNNTADAAWLVAVGYDLLGEPLVELPAKNRDALALIRAANDLVSAPADVPIPTGGAA